MKLQCGARRVWDSVLVSFGAFWLSGTLYGDSVTLPPGDGPARLITEVEAILSIVQTNAWIVNDYETYSNDVQSLILPALQGLRSEVDKSTSWSAAGYINNIARSLLESSDPNAVSAGGELLGMSGFWDYAYSTLSQSIAKIEDDFSLVENQQILSSATMEMEQSSPSSSGGTCECPDYTGLLTHIADSAKAIEENTAWTVNLIGLALARGLNVNDETDQFAIGLALGERIAWIRTYSDQLAVMARPIENYNADPASEEDYERLGTYGAVVLQALARMLQRSEGDDTGTNKWSMVDAWRFRWLDTWYTFPTNTTDNPLYVSMSDDATEWFATNVYHVEALTTVSNLTELLGAMVLNVAITNVPETNITNDVQVAVNVERDMADEEVANAEDLERPDENLEKPSLGWLTSIRTTVENLAGEYSRAFENVTLQRPQYVEIWQGHHSDGGIPVNAPAWVWELDPGSAAGYGARPFYNSTLSRACLIIRDLFSVFWIVLSVWFSWYAIIILALALRLGWWMSWAFVTGKSAEALNAISATMEATFKHLGIKWRGQRFEESGL